MPYPGPPGVDNYRPPQGDFTFRMNKPSGVQDPDNYRPQSGRQRSDRRKPSPRRDSRTGNRHRGPHDRPSGHGIGPRPVPDTRFDRRYGGRQWRPFIAAERELLKTDLDTGSEVAFFDTTGGATFRSIDELSDSDEADMDISGDEDAEVEEPSHKRARLTVGQSASDDNTPKWSNPDPYTALPPEMAPQGKKKDVVQMIRKARVQTKETRTSLPSEAADFISFDLDESEPSDKEKEEKPDPATDATSSVASGIPDGQSARRGKVHVLYPDPTPAALGTRKRTHDDEIKMPHTTLKKVVKDHAKGHITKEWLADPKLTATPWMVGDHSQSATTAVWLHKEIVDFYEYVRPRDFEERLRAQLVQDLKKFCRETFRDAEVYPFGSFPSGLYLPTADMDLVFMSDQYLRGGSAKYHTKTFLYRFRGQLTYNKIAWENEIEIIPSAKVPLVKFIERKTGLKVDVSFENNTGVTAINTFKGWREQYPGMPALVTLIKQFLLMRGLNEPVNGGIGGFSVICLVVSMLQMMPEVQSGNLDTRHHLGQLLLHFFDLYGNKFDYQTIAISTNPPQWIPKVSIPSTFPPCPGRCIRI
jgi:non-canonical poly(A) RNA polymerase PAPD5/7